MDLKEYRKQIKRRLVINVIASSIIIILIVIRIVLLTLNIIETRGFQDGFLLGLAIASTFIFIKYIVNYTKSLKSDELLQVSYIEENDERLKTIKEKSGQLPYLINYFILLLSAIIIGFFNITIMKTLIACCFMISIIKCCLTKYYMKKL